MSTTSKDLDLTRVPVLVGAGQITNREDDPSLAPDPFELMREASVSAVGAMRHPSRPSSPFDAVTHMWMVHSLSLRHGDPASELAERLGITAAQTRCSGMGGSIPQWLVNRACDLVVTGARPFVLLVGAEALATRRRARKQGIELDWPKAPGWPATWPELEPDLGIHPVERQGGLEQATTIYALVETALQHSAGRDAAQQRSAIGRLMERFNAVAVENPFSWFGTARRAEELMTVSRDNRMVCYPYPKYVNAVMDVDMGAAVVITDAATARERGLSPEEVAYVNGWADAHEVWYLSERPAVDSAPALTACGAEALECASLTTDDIAAFDLYSCFPSSIEVARASFGLSEDDPRPLTLTGGLPYHGGPGSNYVTHALANTLEHVRRGGGPVVVHGNGYYLTKHAVGVYSNTPGPTAPEGPDPDLQKRLDAAANSLPVRAPTEIVGEGDATSATVVAYTAPFDREGRTEQASAVVEVGGARTVVRCDEPLSEDLVSGDRVGTKVALRPTEDGVEATSA